MKPTPDDCWRPDPQQLAAYFDGELEGRDDVADLRARIERWLDAHPEAAEERAGHQRLQRLWLETSPAEPSAATWNQLLNRIDAGRRRPVASSGRAWLAGAVLAASIALFVGFLLGGLRLMQPGAEKAEPLALVPPPRKDDVEVFPVASASEVAILRVEGADTGALVIGELPVHGPLELADPGDVRVVHVRPDARDQMLPSVRQQGPDRPMIWARVDTEE
jgi:anti-sigma factor RsiW